MERVPSVDPVLTLLEHSEIRGDYVGGSKERAMNVADERSRSCWIEDAPAIEASPMQSDQKCDVAVIGSGIAGLSTACELSRFGRSVIVIDRGKIRRAMRLANNQHRYLLLRRSPRSGSLPRLGCSNKVAPR